jgi:hypothetical protein
MPLWIVICVVCAAISHETPSDRLARDVFISSSVVFQGDLPQGEIFLLEFLHASGLVSIHGSNFTTYIANSTALVSAGSSPLLFLGNDTGRVEIVGVGDTYLTVTAFLAHPTCTQIEWLSAGSRFVDHLTASDRLCFVSASETGSVSISGSLGKAELAISGVPEGSTISAIPSSPLKFELISAQLIQIRTEIETTLNLTLNFQSDSNISFTIPDRPGHLNESWADFLSLTEEPVYPPLSDRGPAGVNLMGLVLGGSMLLLVVFLALFVRFVIGDDYYWAANRPEINTDQSIPKLAPNVHEIPQEEKDSDMDEVESEHWAGEAVAVETVPENPYDQAGAEPVFVL